MIYFGYLERVKNWSLYFMKSQIGQWGNSLAVRIPKYMVEALDLKLNDAVEFSVEDGKLVLEPIHSLPELSLEELLAGITDSPEPEVDWGKPMGNEVW
jgi:antitoxin MazE